MKGLTHEQSKQLKADIVEYRKRGHYVRECCEHFGVNQNYVFLACKGIDYPWIYDTETMSRAAKEQNKDVRANPETAIKHLEKSAPWCEYVGGYTSWQCYIDVKCKTCGTVLKRSFTTLRQGKTKCTACEKQKAIAKQRIEAEEKKAKRFQKIRAQKCRQISMKMCPTCGGVFVPSHGLQVYCSQECSKRANNAITKDRRVRLINSRDRDNGITLERLYQKSKGVCAICGTACDWNDYHYAGSFFIADNNYPSIDHIVPLSKGGKHAWSNVQLAHRICNTKKGASIALPSEAI